MNKLQSLACLMQFHKENFYAIFIHLNNFMLPTGICLINLEDTWNISFPLSLSAYASFCKFFFIWDLFFILVRWLFVTFLLQVCHSMGRTAYCAVGVPVCSLCHHSYQSLPWPFHSLQGKCILCSFYLKFFINVPKSINPSLSASISS